MYCFNEIWGNHRLISHLKQAVVHEKISHAYLFLGEEGMGKTRIANTFAKYILCENAIEEPCGSCKSCITFNSNNHPDIIIVPRDTKVSSIGVDEIRTEILENIHIKPYESRKKIYIITQGDKLTLAAQNALLKTLEEPPEYAIIFLLARKRESFLPTIHSRVLEVSIPPLSETIVVEYLYNKFKESRNDLEIIGAYAQGSIGRAISLIEDPRFSEMREKVIEKLIKLPSMPLGEILLLAKEWDIYKQEKRFLDILELWYRDVFVIKSLKKDEFLIQKDKKTEIFAQSYEFTSEILAQQVNSVIRAKEKLEQKGNFRLVIEVLLLELKENGS